MPYCLNETTRGIIHYVGLSWARRQMPCSPRIRWSNIAVGSSKMTKNAARRQWGAALDTGGVCRRFRCSRCPFQDIKELGRWITESSLRIYIDVVHFRKGCFGEPAGVKHASPWLEEWAGWLVLGPSAGSAHIPPLARDAGRVPRRA